MVTKLFQWIGNSNNEPSNQVTYNVDTKAFQKQIRYKFEDKELLLQALRHRSFLSQPEQQLDSNERLEFLGDAVLNFIVTDFLYKKYGSENEGVLSQKKSVLVSRQVLGKISDELNLGAYLILNKGEEKTGGRKRLSNLANLFEAILGAIYLDAGIDKSKEFVKRFLLNRYKEFLETKSFFNFKSLLLEFAQSKSWGPPQYMVVDELGPDHKKLFRIKVQAGNKILAEGNGPNKKNAEQNAARNALSVLKKEYPELNFDAKSE